MRYRNTIIALGFAILLCQTPIVGVPQFWKDVVVDVAGFAVVVLAYLAGKERINLPQA